MADINVVRKRPTVWPWVIGVILLAVLAWGVIRVAARGNANTVPADTAAAARGNPIP
jgi:hypothetical protein